MNSEKALSALQLQTITYATDTLIAYSPTSNADVRIPVTNFIPMNILDKALTPANSAATPHVPQGSMWTDENYIYIGCAGNVIKRAAISTF